MARSFSPTVQSMFPVSGYLNSVPLAVREHLMTVLPDGSFVVIFTDYSGDRGGEGMMSTTVSLIRGSTTGGSATD